MCAHDRHLSRLLVVDHEKGLTLRDYSRSSSIDEIREKTAADFEIGKDCKPWAIPSI